MLRETLFQGKGIPRVIRSGEYVLFPKKSLERKMFVTGAYDLPKELGKLGVSWSPGGKDADQLKDVKLKSICSSLKMVMSGH